MLSDEEVFEESQNASMVNVRLGNLCSSIDCSSNFASVVQSVELYLGKVETTDRNRSEAPKFFMGTVA